MPANSPVGFLFVFFSFLLWLNVLFFPLSFIRKISSTASLQWQSHLSLASLLCTEREILGYGSQQMGRTAEPGIWCISNLPGRDFLSCLERHPMKAKLFLRPSPCYILHIDNHWVGSSSGPVGDKEVSLLWEQMWYWGVQVPPSLWFLWALNRKLGLQIMAQSPHNQSSLWALSGPPCENGFTRRRSFRSAQSQPESMQG